MNVYISASNGVGLMTPYCPECYRSVGHSPVCSASPDRDLAPAPCDICGEPATPRRFHGGDSVGWRYDLRCAECRAIVRDAVPSEREGGAP